MQPGGAETLLANSLAQNGLQEHIENILVFFKGPSHLLERIDPRVKVINLNYKNYFGLPKLLVQLKKIISDNKIDLIHTHLNPASTYTHLICPFKIPHIHTIHTTYSVDKETRRINLWLERIFFLKRKNANCILLTEYNKEDFLRSIPFKGRAFVLGNFVPDKYFSTNYSKNKNTEIKLLAVGRLNDVKNYKYLLAVFKYLKTTPITLDIFGGGDTEEYTKIINAENLNIRMMGLVEDTSTIYQNYDAFIMPSLFEGFPLAMLEAMANGLPCILSDIEPLQMLAKEAAVYITLNNAKDASLQLKNYIGDKKLMTSIADKGKIFATEYGKRERYVNNLLDIYKQITN